MVGRERLSVSIGTEYDEGLRLNAKIEHVSYLEKQELPMHFIEAGKWLREQVITKSEFYEQYKEMYVAVISLEPPVIEIGNNIVEVLKRSYQRWGLRPIHTLKMDPVVLMPHRGPSPFFMQGG